MHSSRPRVVRVLLGLCYVALAVAFVSPILGGVLVAVSLGLIVAVWVACVRSTTRPSSPERRFELGNMLVLAGLAMGLLPAVLLWGTSDGAVALSVIAGVVLFVWGRRVRDRAEYELQRSPRLDE